MTLVVSLDSGSCAMRGSRERTIGVLESMAASTVQEKCDVLDASHTPGCVLCDFPNNIHMLVAGFLLYIIVPCV